MCYYLMMVILEASVIALLTILLSVITVIHVYWMLGGKKGLNAVSSIDTQPFQSKLSSFQWVILSFFIVSPVVAILCFLIASLYPKYFPFILPYQAFTYQLIAVLLMIRGLSFPLINKFSKQTTFIFLNTRLYSPVAFLLGVLFASLLFV